MSLGAGIILTSIGLAEASLVYKPGNFGLVVRYAVGQVFPSFVGETICAKEIATRWGRDATKVLRDLTTKQEYRLTKYHVARGLFGTLFGVSQIVKATRSCASTPRTRTSSTA